MTSQRQAVITGYMLQTRNRTDSGKVPENTLVGWMAEVGPGLVWTFRAWAFNHETTLHGGKKAKEGLGCPPVTHLLNRSIMHSFIHPRKCIFVGKLCKNGTLRVGGKEDRRDKSLCSNDPPLKCLPPPEGLRGEYNDQVVRVLQENSTNRMTFPGSTQVIWVVPPLTFFKGYLVPLFSFLWKE